MEKLFGRDGLLPGASEAGARHAAAGRLITRAQPSPEPPRPNALVTATGTTGNYVPVPGGGVVQPVQAGLPLK